MTIENANLDSIQSSLNELRVKLNMLLNNLKKALEDNHILTMSKQIDEIINFYTYAVNRIATHNKLDKNDTNQISSNIDFKNLNYFNTHLHDIKGDLVEVCINILFILYFIKDSGSITDEEYRKHTLYKKQLLQISHPQTVNDLIGLLEL